MENPSADYDAICSEFPTDQSPPVSVLQDPSDGENNLIVDVPQVQLTDDIARNCDPNIGCSLTQSSQLCLTPQVNGDDHTLDKTEVTDCEVGPLWITGDKVAVTVNPTEYFILQGHNQLTLTQPDADSPLLVLGNNADNSSYEVNVMIDKGNVKTGVIKLAATLNDKNTLTIDEDRKFIVQRSNLFAPQVISPIPAPIEGDEMGDVRLPSMIKTFYI